MSIVPTVPGTVDSSELGRVLVHEHVFVLGSAWTASTSCCPSRTA
ncbi:hypothetical protein ACIRRA_08575 [Nocardia sp. NPDC101769]